MDEDQDIHHLAGFLAFRHRDGIVSDTSVQS